MAYETTDELLAEISDHWVKEPNGNLYKLLDTYNGGFEQISDMANQVEEWRAIQDAKGTTLDLFGQNLSTSRPTQKDDSYRFLLRLKVLLSRAQGTLPSITHITNTALGTTQGTQIWNTDTPRHAGIQLPWDYINDNDIQQFLLANLKHMIPLGYWINEIIFRTSTKLPLYTGVGVKGRISNTSIWSSNTVWWAGWKAKTGNQTYAGVISRYIVSSVWSTETG